MDIEALPSFELTFEGYCQAIATYTQTNNPYIIRWIAVVNNMLASGELEWEPAQTTEERRKRLHMIRNVAFALGLWSQKLQEQGREIDQNFY